MNRRNFLSLLVGSGAALCFSGIGSAQSAASKPADDDAFLDDLSQRSFRYFWEQSDPNTGIVRDRAHTDAHEYAKEKRDIGTTGGTGFAITAMCIGADRGWVSRADALGRVRATLQTFANGPVKNEHGWFYHFLNTQSGQRTGAAYDTAQFGVPPNSNSNR